MLTTVLLPYLVVALASLGAAGLTMYSGFGLGTLLLPIFALFFPVEMAVAATAVVHMANNLFKIALVGRYADRGLIINFGVPALLAALVGAAALGLVAGLGTITSYTLGPHTATITPIKLLMGCLIFVFALFELLPRLRQLKFDRRYLPLGGLLSGFFGGLSGHQGALRSAFLVKTGVSTEAFVGTNAVIAFMVDLARLATYGIMFWLAGTLSPLGAEQWPLVLTGIIAAFSGVILGKRLLDKVTMGAIKTLTGVLLLAIAIALGAGLV
ncbi:TSUP family transporter [Desulfurivibrio sp. D14AmB]|uniref:TSUP family transporter n=1 Tax=Desulfurivibrio sp. D14AmB TaxID=3374370 RepID=UPI00376ECA4D